MKKLFNLNLTFIKFIYPALLIAVLSGAAFGATFTVTNTNDSGAGSLRQAVLDANAAPGDDVIEFDATVFGTAQTIVLTGGALQVFNSGRLTINGTNAAAAIGCCIVADG